MSPQTAAPLPPDIVQQQSPEQAQSVFAQQGLDQPQQGMQVVQQIGQKLKELDQWAQQIKTLLDNFDPSLSVLLVPIAQAAQDMMKALQEKAQRSGMARGSSVMPQPPAQNPAAGPPNPVAQ